MGEPPNDFAQQVRSLRRAQGLTVRDLAHLVGVSKVTIWKWEKGESQPRARMISPLASALNVPTSQLRQVIDGKPSMAQSQPAEVSDPAELAEVIANAKRMIAEASGASPQNITISIEY